MLNQPTASDPTGGNTFIEGKDVFDVSGVKVGSVSWQNPQAGYLVIQKGWLFANELYVPFSVVTGQDSRGLFLNLTKEDLKDERWKAPPTAAEMTPANASMPAGPMGEERASVAAPTPPMERQAEVSDQEETVSHMQGSAQETDQAMPVPPRESVVTDDGRPVDGQHIEDEQAVAVEMAPDAADTDGDQSSTADADLSASAQPLPDEMSVDEDVVAVSPDTDANQGSPSDDLDAAAPPSYAEPAVEADAANVNMDSAAPEVDQSSPSAPDLAAEEQPLHATTAGDTLDTRSDVFEQRVLDRMEGAAAGVAATQNSARAAAPAGDHRSGAALRAALLVGFDVALQQDAARQLSEHSPRGSADHVSELLARVGPADVPTLAPLLAAAWRAALAVAADNPSGAVDVRQALERLARD